MAIRKGGLLDGGDSEEEENDRVPIHRGNKFLRLPYALAKERGLDTIGLSPRQVWDLLAGYGVNAQTEMDKLGDDLESLREREQAENPLPEKDNGTEAERKRLLPLNERLYQPDTIQKFLSHEELKQKFSNVSEKKPAQVMANYILSNLDGELFTEQDLKNIFVDTFTKAENKTAMAFYQGSSGIDTNYNLGNNPNAGKNRLSFNVAGRVPTDESIAKVRAKYGNDYHFTMEYRLPEEKRVKSIADHETGHAIDFKFRDNSDIQALQVEIDNAKNAYEKASATYDSHVKEYGYDSQQVREWQIQRSQAQLRYHSARKKAHLAYYQNKKQFPSHTIMNGVLQRGITREQIKKELSVYSATDALEFFSEGYSAIRNIPKEQYTPTMQAFADEFNQYFKEKLE